MRAVAAWAIAAALVVIGSLTSCDYQVTGYDKQPAMTRAPYLDRVIVYSHWVQDIDVIVASGACTPPVGEIFTGCAQLRQIGPDDWRCDFWAQQPADFNDTARLVVAGHEVAMHCFGATHG